MKIVKLDIDENSILAGIDAVALVEQPAIEEDFIYFSKHTEEFAVPLLFLLVYRIYSRVLRCV